MTQEPSGAKKASPGDQVDDKVVDATLTAYYPAVISSVDAARARAQTAYTVASATAGALVAAGIIADIPSYDWWVQAAAGVAFAAWAFAAALFMYVSTGVQSSSQPATQLGQPESDGIELLSAGDFVFRALTTAKYAAAVIESRLHRAIYCVWFALVATALAIALAVVFPPTPASEDVTLNLTPAGQKIVATACAADPESISGTVETATLDDKWILVNTAPGVCGKDEEVVGVPSAQVQSVEKRGGFPWVGLP